MPKLRLKRRRRQEEEFGEKLWDAFQEDERLDGISARFNDYAHIPDRWAPNMHDAANPQHMDDDEYAEWIREGMWKRKHAREYEEQLKRDAQRVARRAREKEKRAETARLKRLALAQEERRRKERQRQQEEDYRQRYEQRWKSLLDIRMSDHGPLSFQDIPWPLFSPQQDDSEPFHLEHITPGSISAFLLSGAGDTAVATTKSDDMKRNKDKLKETLLRFHPDKFEGRLMHRVLQSDKTIVREAVGQVARALNTLLSEKS